MLVVTSMVTIALGTRLLVKNIYRRVGSRQGYKPTEKKIDDTSLFFIISGACICMFASVGVFYSKISKVLENQREINEKIDIMVLVYSHEKTLKRMDEKQ